MSLNLKGTSLPAEPRSISRRGLIRTASAAAGIAAGSGALTGFPTIWAQNVKDVTLVHAGPPVAAIPQIGEQATKDLGFTIRMQATENADLLNRFLSQSSAIDFGDVTIVYMKYIVGRNVLQAIPLSKYGIGIRRSRFSPRASTQTAAKPRPRVSLHTLCSTQRGPTDKNSRKSRPNG